MVQIEQAAGPTFVHPIGIEKIVSHFHSLIMPPLYSVVKLWERVVSGRGNERLDAKATAVYHDAEGEGGGSKIPPESPACFAYLFRKAANLRRQIFTTVFVDTRLWKTKHSRKRFQNFRQSYVLLTDRIKIHQSQPLA